MWASGCARACIKGGYQNGRLLHPWRFTLLAPLFRMVGIPSLCVCAGGGVIRLTVITGYDESAACP